MLNLLVKAGEAVEAVFRAESVTNTESTDTGSYPRDVPTTHSTTTPQVKRGFHRATKRIPIVCYE